MLENKKFVEWANENIVVVVGHTEDKHPTEYEDDKGKKVPGCPVYRGLTCEQHRAITGECRNPPDDLPKIEVGNGMPNSWLVAPDGTVVALEPADQQVASKIEDKVAELQKAAGKHLTWKKYGKYLDAFETGDAAVREGELKAAIKAYQKVEKDAKKLPAGMTAEVDKRLEALNAKAVEALEAIKTGDEEVVKRLKAANKLKNEVGLRFKRGYLPVVDEIKTWIKETKAAAK